MKLALIGAGGFRAPLMHVAVARASERIGVDEVVAYDVDAQRLERIGAVTRALAAHERVELKYRVASTLADALEGADFIFCAIRVGGIEGRIVDEAVPIAEGVVGQETTGPGGISFALRTIPAVLDLAQEVARQAPSAWFLNFTNPAGLVTEALRPVLGDRVIGICDGPPTMFRRVAEALEQPPDDLDFDYFGLNHLGWLKAVRHAGVDLLPDLLADDGRLSKLAETRIFSADWLRSLGLIPHEYLYYYYSASEAVAAMREGGKTRAEYIFEAQSSFYEGNNGTKPEELLAGWETILREREKTYMSETGVKVHSHSADGVEHSIDGYTGVAIATIEAIVRKSNRVLVLNTANRGALPFLSDEAVVEVPCIVGAAGLRPLAVGPIPQHCRGLIEIVKDVERTTIEAALTGSPSLAIKALALHPLVPSRETARRIFERYCAQHAEIRAQFIH